MTKKPTTITLTIERELPDQHDLTKHTRPNGTSSFKEHTRSWYQNVGENKCPMCGITPEFTQHTVKEVIEDKPKVRRKIQGNEFSNSVMSQL